MVVESKELGGRLSSVCSPMFYFPNVREVITGKMKYKDLWFLELGTFPKIQNDKDTGVEEMTFVLIMGIGIKPGFMG